MKTYIKVLLLMVFIFIMEAVPFLYDEAYALKDMKWGWIVGMPLVLFFWDTYQKGKTED